MISFVLAVTFLALAFVLPRYVPDRANRLLRRVGQVAVIAICGVLSFASALATSIVSVPADSVGVVQKKFGFDTLKDGHYIATDGQNGYQAEIIQPGTFRISLFFNVLNEVHVVPVVVVPQGYYGRIVATDGESLPTGQVMAYAWPDAEFTKYLDAKYFLDHHGTKGLQLSVLKPGVYPINLALFQVKVGSGDRETSYDVSNVSTTDRKDAVDTTITRVPTGSVGVVRSSVQEMGKQCQVQVAKTVEEDQGGLAAEVVPEGCKGVWNSSLPPNDYYLNRAAYDVTMVSTRVTTLEFKGGFTRRYIDLKVGSAGDFVQTERSQSVPVPEGSADSAVNTKCEGWEIPQELRAVVQITPEHAPVVVAAVGGQAEVDQRIVIPSIRSYVRNVFGGSISVTEKDKDGKDVSTVRPTRVLDTIEQRPALERAILNLVQVDGRRAGVDVKEIRLGESAIPPELLLARQRQQLAGQLKLAYEQEKTAQEQRQAAEQAKATAEQQSVLVKAQIGVQTAKLNAQERQAQGLGEQEYLKAIAAGQDAQARVLGPDAAVRLQVIKVFIDALGAHPDILGSLRMPQVLVMGGGGLEGPAGILGNLLVGGGAKAVPKPSLPGDDSPHEP